MNYPASGPHRGIDGTANAANLRRKQSEIDLNENEETA